MWITFLSTLLVITLTSAEYLYESNPYAHYGEYASAYDNYKPTDYKFEYGVSDPHTGDHKSQWEVKENGVVRGAYSLLEPDGTTRVVEYYADDTGFHADVKKIGTAVHDAPHYGNLHPIAEAHVADSLAYNGYGHGGFTHSYGAPIAAVAKIAAPVPIHAAPIAQVQHIAPVPQVIAPQIHHAGTPLNIDFDHHHQFYAQTPEHYPTPVLQHPAPFKIAEEHFSPVVKVPTPHLVHQAPQVFHEGPQILHKTYENHNQHYQPEEVLIKTLNYPAPESVPQYYAKYLEPQVVKSYAQPQLVKTYAEPQLVKSYAEPQLLKSYSEPQLVKTYAEPQLVKISEPQVVKTFVEPQPQLVKTYAAPPPQIIKSYGEPQVYLPAPPPQPVLSKGYALPIHTAPKVTNPFTKFFAPLAKYFTAPAPPKVAAVKVAPQQIYAAPAPAPVTKYISNDYADYQAYKPEVVVSSPHNYQSPAYSFSHEY